MYRWGTLGHHNLQARSYEHKILLSNDTALHTALYAYGKHTTRPARNHRLASSP